MEKLESLLMVSGQVICHALIGTELVNSRLKMTKHVLHRFTGFLGEVLILTSVGLEKPSLDDGCPLMASSEGSPHLTSCLEMTDVLVLGSAKSRKEHVHRLIVALESSHK